MAKETMKAIFKVTPEGKECIAFLPEVLSNPGNIFSYMHVGQGGEASSEFFYECSPASWDESHELETEISNVYDVEVIRIKRLPRWWSWFDKFE